MRLPPVPSMIIGMNYAICHGWNPLMSKQVTCTLQAGAIFAMGPVPHAAGGAAVVDRLENGETRITCAGDEARDPASPFVAPDTVATNYH
jgi:hypothetical protein